MLHCRAMTSFPYTAISPARLYTPQGSCFPPWSQFKPWGSEHANSCRSILTFQFLDSCEEGILAKVIKTDSTSQLEPESRVEGFPSESGSVSHPRTLLSRDLSCMGLVFLLSMYCQARLGKFSLLCSNRLEPYISKSVCVSQVRQTEQGGPYHLGSQTLLQHSWQPIKPLDAALTPLTSLASCVHSSFLTKYQAAGTQSNYCFLRYYQQSPFHKNVLCSEALWTKFKHDNDHEGYAALQFF